MKNMTLAFHTLAFALSTFSGAATANDDLILRKSFQSSSSETPTHWKETQFSSTNYCNRGWTNQTQVQEGYGRYLEYHDPTFNPYMATEVTYWQTGASHYIFGPGDEHAEVYHPRIKCNWVLGNSEDALGTGFSYREWHVLARGG